MTVLELNVAQFNQIMSDIIHHQLQLNQLCIHGEITQFNYYSSKKHLYLTLAYEGASLQCVIYNQHLKKLPVIKKGDSCKLIGQCRFLKNKGQLIFSAVTIIQDGLGNQQKEHEKIRKQLDKEGIFNQKDESQLPQFLNHICIITANESAAFHDICSIISNNNHTFKTSIIPSTMQGLIAANEIITAIETAKTRFPDLICISRGGGAEQDFLCFNDEQLTRYIAKQTIPIITGIGHQINTTFACLSANKYFETPTAMSQYLCEYSMAPFNQFTNQLIDKNQNLQMQLQQYGQKTQTIHQQCFDYLTQNMKQIEHQYQDATHQIALLNPLEKLTNGYAYCTTNKKKPIKSVQVLKRDDTINLRFWNGNVSATVNDINKN